MPIVASCPQCSSKLKAPDEAAGRKIRCPKCQNVVPVPAANSGDLTPAPAARPAPPPTRKANPESVAARKPSPPPPPPKKPAPPPVDELEEIEDDDDHIQEEEDEAPRRKKSVKVKESELLGELPPKLEEKVREELSKGERLIWVGQPMVKLYMLRGVVGSCIGSIFAGVGLFMGLVMIWNMGVLALLPAFIFGGIGLAIMLAPLWKKIEADNTVYALTNRRAIVWRGRWWGGCTLKSYTSMDLRDMRRQDSWFVKEAGDLVFEQFTVVTVHSKGGMSRQVYQYGFMGIEHVRDVEKLIREELVDPLLDRLR